MAPLFSCLKTINALIEKCCGNVDSLNGSWLDNSNRIAYFMQRRRQPGRRFPQSAFGLLAANQHFRGTGRQQAHGLSVILKYLLTINRHNDIVYYQFELTRPNQIILTREGHVHDAELQRLRRTSRHSSNGFGQLFPQRIKLDWFLVLLVGLRVCSVFAPPQPAFPEPSKDAQAQ